MTMNGRIFGLVSIQKTDYSEDYMDLYEIDVIAEKIQHRSTLKSVITTKDDPLSRISVVSYIGSNVGNSSSYCNNQNMFIGNSK